MALFQEPPADPTYDATFFYRSLEVRDLCDLKTHSAGTGSTYAQFASNLNSLETIVAMITYDGANTSIQLADSDETLTAYTFRRPVDVRRDWYSEHAPFDSDQRH
ncbi:hypothetical protein [Pontiella sulfatireligans]|uniref:hypothetical protein n=1 Tax=Pontiella sulfatireligans TaxID=2750658 RepID=UPI00109D7C83|nr:hypothetical protein [Pontiella sulfatireligans]